MKLPRHGAVLSKDFNTPLDHAAEYRLACGKGRRRAATDPATAGAERK